MRIRPKVKSNQWGYFKILLQGKGWWFKKLTFKNGFTSKQTHKKRDEIWVIYVPAGCKHKIGGKGDVLELALGEPDEKDIIRYDVNDGNVKGFILAAGLGTRLRPLTYEIAKPLITVDKIPIINRQVDLYLKYGIKDIVINIPTKFKDDFYKWKESYYKDINIEFIIEDEPTGTMLPLSKTRFDNVMVVANADEMKDFNLREMIAFHKENDAVATLGLTEVENPSAFGVVEMDGDKIKKFWQKPKNPPTNLINAGIYILNPEVMEYMPKDVNFSMMEKYLFTHLIKEKKLYGYKMKGTWINTGTWNEYGNAIKTLKK